MCPVCGVERSSYFLMRCGHQGPCSHCVPPEINGTDAARAIYGKCMRANRDGRVCGKANDEPMVKVLG